MQFNLLAQIFGRTSLRPSAQIKRMEHRQLAFVGAVFDPRLCG
ncbi:MAG: hypothetical protein VX148_08685 [Pseudomonadota bacterium]|nr:hypothetical protein [Pseudomonadota bacterium]